MCVRFSDSEGEVCVQKRQHVGERRERAAAIFASIDSLISSSVIASGTPRVGLLCGGGSEIIDGEDDCWVSTSALGTSSW